MVRMWYYEGKQPKTAKPFIIPICEENWGINPIISDGTYKFKHPVLIQLYCSNQGASIGYTFQQDENPRWLLYTKPFLLEKGKTILRVKATRIGYKESEEIKATFTIE